MFKRFLKTMAASIMITSIAVSSVFADNVDDLKKEQSQKKNELDTLENDLAYLLTKLDDLEQQMASKAAEIESLNAQLVEAEEKQQKQYDDMKLRIKYMYEDQTVSFMEVFLTSSDMSTVLNKTQYMQSVYDYDRDRLAEMAETAAEINSIKESLESDQESIDAAQKELTEKQSALYTTIDSKKSEISNLDSKISAAVEKAAQETAKKYQTTVSYDIPSNANNDSVVASRIVANAYALMGTPYISGGSSPDGFDCSGFTSYLFAQEGIGISRSSSAQVYGGEDIPNMSMALPGDIVCYPGHVGLYVGNGMMIHANRPGGSVRLVGVYSIEMPVIAIRRYW